MTHRIGTYLAAICLVASMASARPAAQDHGQYTQSEIDTGARLYSSQCSTCHGPNGDRISGIDLRRGQFRRAVTDDDLMRIVTSGVPGRRHAAVYASAGGTHRNRGLHPRRTGFRYSLNQDRHRGAREDDRRGQGRVPLVSSHRRQRLARGAGSLRHWRGARCRHAAPLAH